MSKKIVFLTHCEDDLVERFGTRKCLNSFKYFHPEIPIVHLGTEKMAEIYKEHPWAVLTSFMPLTMKKVKEEYSADFVVHVDSDSIVLSRLDEILDGDYDIASVRNNCDSHLGDERNNRAIQIRDLPNWEYVNCGLISTSSDKFLNEWIQLNKEATEKTGSINFFPLAEQGSFNLIFKLGGYKTKILDPIGSSVFYGPSANMYDEDVKDNPEHIINEWTYNGWQSWRKIIYKEDKFWLYGKQVKLLHQAGGGNAKTAQKLTFDMFNAETAKRIKEITNFDRNQHN